MRLLAILAVLALFSYPAGPRAAEPLRADAAKVDVTPRIEGSAGQALGILDPLFVRALVIESGGRRAALVEQPDGEPVVVLARRAEQLAVIVVRLLDAVGLSKRTFDSR